VEGTGRRRGGEGRERERGKEKRKEKGKYKWDLPPPFKAEVDAATPLHSTQHQHSLRPQNH